jgi:hypothetical protein
MFLELLRMTASAPFRNFHLWIVIEVRNRRYNTLSRIFDNLHLYCTSLKKQQLCKIALFLETE